MNTYTDFLKNKDFIRWQLTPDAELNAYWENFRKSHPHLENELQKAIDYLKSEGLNRSTLTNAEREQTLHGIQRAIQREEKQRKVRVIRYSVASSAAVLLLLIGVTFFMSRQKGAADPEAELIVGELLNSQDIQLITSNKAITFQNDVALVLDETGNVKITHENTEVETVTVEKEKINSLIVPYGKRSTLTLSDGSKVWLNSGSVFEFPAKFTGDKRVIHLVSGEMYIEVAEDRAKPLHVHTPDFQVRVLGTAFNVSAYENMPPSVVLVNGSVTLQADSKKEETLLSPNELANYDPHAGVFVTQEVNVDNYTTWRNGYLTLDKTPMTEVLKQIGRYYNISFNYDQDVNLQRRTCTGKIYLSENLDNVMTTVTLLSSTRYMKENNRIYITNELE